MGRFLLNTTIPHFKLTENLFIYSSKEITGHQPTPVILQPQQHEDKIKEIMSLERINNLHIKDNKQIAKIETSNKDDINHHIPRNNLEKTIKEKI